MFCSTRIFISNKLQLTWSSSIQEIVFITVIKIIFFPIFLFVFPTLCTGNNRNRINTFNRIHLQLEIDLREINETYNFLWLLKSTMNLSYWYKYIKWSTTMRGLSKEASSIQHSTCLLCTLQYCFLLPSCDSSLSIKRITTWPIYWQSIKDVTWSIFIFSTLFNIHFLLRWQGEFVYQTDVRRNNAGHH